MGNVFHYDFIKSEGTRDYLQKYKGFSMSGTYRNDKGFPVDNSLLSKTLIERKIGENEEDVLSIINLGEEKESIVATLSVFSTYEPRAREIGMQLLEELEAIICGFW